MHAVSHNAWLSAIFVPQHLSVCNITCGHMQSLQKKVPHSFELMGQRKGFVRYMSPDLRVLVKQHAEALEDRETALAGILQVTLCILFLPAGPLHAFYCSFAQDTSYSALP